MTTFTISNIEVLDAHQKELLCNYLTKRGLEFAINELDDKKPISAPKQKKSAPKQSKSSDDFDRTKYVQVASALGCYGKKGVWKSCRQFVYAVMDGEITEAQGIDLVNQLKASKGWA